MSPYTMTVRRWDRFGATLYEAHLWDGDRPFACGGKARSQVTAERQLAIQVFNMLHDPIRKGRVNPDRFPPALWDAYGVVIAPSVVTP